MSTINEKKNRIAAFNAGLNPETLKPAWEWEQASADDVRLILALCSNLSGSKTGSLVGVEGRQVRKWTAGDARIPYAAWALLVHEAGLGWIASVKG
ncbi:hypothetical protein [Pantoea coffeiphila]|uniref:hypothetical protein n=1 Tax=Pantoea coffeiphila TaxID=1465635 RepID=UPI001C0E949A|nr:hypothetical protein [Pantoea coffeiphila]